MSTARHTTVVRYQIFNVNRPEHHGVLGELRQPVGAQIDLVRNRRSPDASSNWADGSRSAHFVEDPNEHWIVAEWPRHPNFHLLGDRHPRP